MMKMTVIDMMNRIAQAVQDLDAAKPGEEREQAIADADEIVKMSQQFFNGADLVVRVETLMAKNKTLDCSRINNVIGE